MRIVCNAWRDLAHPQAGGSERYVDEMLRSLQRLGHEVCLVAGGPVAPRDYQVIDAGGTFTQYVRAPFVRRRFGTADLVIDIANGLAHCTPLTTRCPTLLVWHHLHGPQWQHFFPRPLAAVGDFAERRVLPAVYRRSSIVVESASTRQELISLGIDPSRLHLLPVAVEQHCVVTARSAEPSFVALGRLVPQKRIELLLEIWDTVRPDVGGRLTIIGDGPEGPRLRQLNRPGVTFQGHVDDETKTRILAQSWLLLHAAEQEGWGIAITEAGVQGTPALGFSVPGVRDAVRDGETGLLAQTPQEFAEHWRRLAHDDLLRERLGTAARAYAATFTTERATAALNSIIIEAGDRLRVE